MNVPNAKIYEWLIFKQKTKISMEMGYCDKWFYLCLSLVGVILAGLVMIFKYFIKLDRNGVRLGQADKEHEHKHSQNEQRINELKDLVIKLQTRIIGCEKNGGHKSVNIVPTGTPPPPPMPGNKSMPELKKQEKVKKTHADHLKEALEKRRKKIEGENN